MSRQLSNKAWLQQECAKNRAEIQRWLKSGRMERLPAYLGGGQQVYRYQAPPRVPVAWPGPKKKRRVQGKPVFTFREQPVKLNRHSAPAGDLTTTCVE